MSKRHKNKPVPVPERDFDSISAPTIYRSTLLAPNLEAMLDKAMGPLKPLLSLRDGPILKQIKQAPTLEALLDLAPEASGLAEPVWRARMRPFGQQMVAPLTQRLRDLAAWWPAPDDQEKALERYLPILREQGLAGAGAIMAGFDALPFYGQALASVTLGALGYGPAAERIWTCHRTLMEHPDKTWFIGALWGLVDLGDPRVDGILAEWLTAGRSFYELYGMLAMAGGRQSFIPLALRLPNANKHDRDDVSSALVGIAHRLGREAVIDELLQHAPNPAPDELRDAQLSANRLLSLPMERVKDYFEIFFQGAKGLEETDI